MGPDISDFFFSQGPIAPSFTVAVLFVNLPELPMEWSEVEPTESSESESESLEELVDDEDIL